MTDLYGSARGTAIQATPPRMPDSKLGGAWIKRGALDTVELAAAAVGDRVFLGRFPLDAILDAFDSKMGYDALGTGVTLSVGDDSDDDALAAAAAASSAGTRAIAASVDIANYCKPLWGMLGYASRDLAVAAQSVKDGGCNLWAKVKAASTTATGTLTWQIKLCD